MFLAACGEVSCCGCVVVEIVLSEVGLNLCRHFQEVIVVRVQPAVVKKQHLPCFEHMPKDVAVFGLKRAINFGCRATGFVI